tara:strand:+ start:2946 stop:3968 length:1023 start_codon:yes stop_codon:yes gene_type:complete
MNFPKTNDKEFQNQFLHILTQGGKDSTYKFAFARFLLDYSKDNDKPKVPFSTISEYFLEYYWHQICNTKIKQTRKDHIKKPEIKKLIKNEFDLDYYSQTFDEIKKQEPQKIQNCLDMIRKKCFKDVTYAFQRLANGTETKIFFKYTPVGWEEKEGRAPTPILDFNSKIILNPKAIDFFRRFHATLSRVVILEWARFLESRNTGFPELISTIEAQIPPRNLSTEKKYLSEFQKKCFYCTKKLSNSDVEVHVEHVIPFSYLKHNQMWNLVLACKDCNMKKMASLPEPKEKWLKILSKRNKKFRNKIRNLNHDLTQLGDNYNEIIKLRYDNAKLQGFLPITMP